jgi:acyl-coenzyme A thioesterase PaaI-like protein
MPSRGTSAAMRSRARRSWFRWCARPPFWECSTSTAHFWHASTITTGPASSAAEERSLQEIYAPQNACFGCGPANEKGLRIRSFVRGDEVVCTWTPHKHHEAFEGMLNGGIIGTLLDCHSNWTAAWHLMQRAQAPTPPCTVTASYAVKLLRPTPSSGPVELRAHVSESGEDRAIVEAQLSVGGETCATCRGLFVAVKPGHPAYHRW